MKIIVALHLLLCLIASQAAGFNEMSIVVNDEVSAVSAQLKSSLDTSMVIKEGVANDPVTLIKEDIIDESGQITTLDWILIISGVVLLIVIFIICCRVHRERQDNYRKP